MSTATGRRAEIAAAEYLSKNGFIILAQNWRRPRCEVDLVCLKNSRAFFRKTSVLYIVEVKYRATSNQGDGLEYITDRKFEQLKYASKVLCSEYDYEGDVRLLAVAVSGPQYVIERVIDLCE